MIRLSAIDGDSMKVTFSWPDDGRDIAVIGDFNNWDPYAHRMRRRSNRTRSVSVVMPIPTQIRFRYVAGDERSAEYFDDPDVDLEPNGLGQTHGLLTLPAPSDRS